MSLLRKTTVGIIGVSSIFAANPGAALAPIGAASVSYTHLTLPTICSV